MMILVDVLGECCIIHGSCENLIRVSSYRMAQKYRIIGHFFPKYRTNIGHFFPKYRTK